MFVMATRPGAKKKGPDDASTVMLRGREDCRGMFDVARR